MATVAPEGSAYGVSQEPEAKVEASRFIPEPLPPSLPTRKRVNKKKQKYDILIVSLLISCGFLSLIFLGSFLGYTIFVDEVEKPVTEADQAAVLTADVFVSKLPQLNLRPSQGRFRKVRRRYGAYETSYIYGVPTLNREGFYIESFAIVLPSVEYANSKFLQASGYLKVGPEWEGKHELKRQELDLPYHWGDECQCAFLMRGTAFVGNVFTARKGRRVFHLILLGPVLNSHAEFKELLEPVLQRLESYNG
jgi:hypothetical protein